jgi:hypothetical protein
MQPDLGPCERELYAKGKGAIDEGCSCQEKLELLESRPETPTRFILHWGTDAADCEFFATEKGVRARAPGNVESGSLLEPHNLCCWSRGHFSD